MASRLSLHSQLSSIMETMAKSVLAQVCTLVDEDSAELRSEISRLLFANSALAEKVNSLECKLTIVRSDSSKMSGNQRSIGVQTVSCSDEEDAPDGIHICFNKENCTKHSVLTICLHKLFFHLFILLLFVSFFSPQFLLLQ